MLEEDGMGHSKEVYADFRFFDKPGRSNYGEVSRLELGFS